MLLTVLQNLALQLPRGSIPLIFKSALKLKVVIKPDWNQYNVVRSNECHLSLILKILMYTCHVLQIYEKLEMG